jgi:hypothetical protein
MPILRPRNRVGALQQRHLKEILDAQTSRVPVCRWEDLFNERKRRSTRNTAIEKLKGGCEMSDSEKSTALLAAHIRAKFRKHTEIVRDIVDRLSDAQLIERWHAAHEEKIARLKEAGR